MTSLPALLLFVLGVSPHQAHLNATLARAAALGDTSKAVLELRKGADVNSLTILGQRPLELAAEYHHFETARLLLDHGALVNGASGFGTPLFWAASNGDTALTRLLLDRGAWTDYGSQGCTPLTAAIFSVARPVAGYTFSGSEVDILPHTPHNLRLARLIEARGEEQSKLDSVDLSPGAVKRHYASHLRIIWLLLKHGARVNRKGGAGLTPLMDAAMTEDVEAARLLLDYGAIVDAKDEGGATALYYASNSEKIDLVKLLVGKGADVNAQVESGDFVLLNAVSEQNVEMVQYLLEHGADPNLPAKSEEPALSVATLFHNAKIIALLQAAGARK